MHEASASVAVPSAPSSKRPTLKTLVFPSADAIHRPPPLREDRPSERPTKPTLPPPAPSVSAIELSASDLEVVEIPPPPASERRPRRDRPRWLGLAVRATLAGAVLFAVATTLMDGPAVASPARVPRLAWPERTAMGEPPPPPALAPPRRGCVATAPRRLVAARASIPPGLDVLASGTGFAVALAPRTDEAMAVRLEGSILRAAESVRVRAARPVRHAAARDAEPLEVVADTDEARTVAAFDGAALAVAGDGASVVARSGGAPRPLWRAARSSARVSAVRAAARDEGGAVVAVKRGAKIELGIVDASLAPLGPLATVVESAGTLGTPSVAAHLGGAVVAWAERAPGAHALVVHVASAGHGAVESRAIGEGMSPAVAVLPDGDVLVAYADGPPSAHRVVVRRLARDLSPASDLVVLSPEGINAGQPALDVHASGRALVAWFAVERGREASVQAAPLACDVSAYRD